LDLLRIRKKLLIPKKRKPNTEKIINPSINSEIRKDYKEDKKVERKVLHKLAPTESEKESYDFAVDFWTAPLPNETVPPTNQDNDLIDDVNPFDI